MSTRILAYTFMLSLSFGSSAYAQGNFMFSSDVPSPPKAAAVQTPKKTEAKVEKATPNPKATTPAPPKAEKPNPKSTVRDPKSEKATVASAVTPDGCSSNFEKAAALIKAAHGKDVELNRIGGFTGNFRGVAASNRFKYSGGSLLLNIAVEPMINTDVPVTICKRGNKVTAKLVTARALEADSNQPQAMIAGMVASGDAPGAITLNVTRNGPHLNFNGSSGQITVQATAAIR